ncbi:glutamine amidotransferase [Stylonychia lemnae]|uniref:Glutamine amidotransferase n=1 Tax=Stylonychia lemnae TaxID=5949 RepID=A0A078A9D3_STYLE|nr:glutamine amidotransferase [Stylonychia lemnae]|eukprot:CDW77388.1 glutamine amidotransferase [Stylonychia lemnae]
MSIEQATNQIRTLTRAMLQKAETGELDTEIRVLRYECPFLYSVVLDTLIIIANQFDFLTLVLHLESLGIKDNNDVYYDKVVEKQVYYALSHLYQEAKQNLSQDQGFITKVRNAISLLQIMSQKSLYRNKLKWLVEVLLGKLFHLVDNINKAREQMDKVDKILKIHYQKRLDDLQTEIVKKQTISFEKLNSIPRLNVSKIFYESYNQGLVFSYQKQMIYTGNQNCHKQIYCGLKYWLTIIKNSKQSYILLLHQYQKGIEIADYLLYTLYETYGQMDKSVRDFLRLEDPMRRAYFYYIAGLTYSIYSDSNECQLYAKRKLMKQKSLELLKTSLQFDSKNPYCLQQAAVLSAELNKVEQSIEYLDLKYSNTVAKVIQIYLNNLFRAKIEQIHHESRKANEAKFNVKDPSQMLVETYMNKESLELNNVNKNFESINSKFSNMIFEKSALNQNGDDGKQMKCFSTLMKLLHQLQVKGDESKLILNDSQISCDNFIDYQSIRLLDAVLNMYEGESAEKLKAKMTIKDIIRSSNETDIEAILVYSEILIELEKYDKAFFYLNHSLKYEYRNPNIWRLLGEVYQQKARLCDSQSNGKQLTDEKTFNLEKAGFSGDFVENMEIFAPYHCLIVLGFEVHAVCPGKSKGEKVATAVHDFVGFQTYTEKQGHNFELNATFDEIYPSDYAGLWIPGGRAPEYLRMNEKVLDLIRHFQEANKPIAAICHGAQLLVALGGLQGRQITCYPACAVELKLAGAQYVDAKVEDAVVDGNIVSGVAWPSNPAVLSQFVKLLGVTITHN